MKKNILKYIVPVLSVTLFASCESVLKEINPTEITGVYDTEELLETNIAGITVDHFFRQPALERFGSASGINTWGVTGESKFNQNDYTYCMNFTVLSTASENRNMFINQYKAIQRCNLIMENLPSSPVAEAYKKEIDAECHFYRAIAYFNLVRYYGDVPLRLTSPNSSDATVCPRSPFWKVFEQVVKDFEYAYDYMRSPERAAEVAKDHFRPNRYAAVAYLSCVYTHIASLLSHPDDNFWDVTKPDHIPDFSALGIKTADDAYRLALKYAEMVLPESATHLSGCKYALVEKISDLYQFTSSFSRNGYTSWNHPEQIMVSSCSIESCCTDYFTRNTVPNYCPNSLQTTSSDNTAKTRPSRFIFEKWCSTYPGTKGSSTFKDVYITSADPRVEATLWYGTLKLSNGNNITTYPYSNSISKNTSYPYYRKYWSSRFAGSYGDADYYDLRLAEIYLNAAEAAAYLGEEVTARNYIEVLHARARHSVADGQSDAAQPDWKTRSFSDKDELLKAIFWERMFELCGEGHEFTDSHRFGAGWIADVLAKPLNEFYALSVNSGLFGKHFAVGIKFLEDKTLLRKSLLCPIPQEEKNTNSGLVWENDFNWGL